MTSPGDVPGKVPNLHLIDLDQDLPGQRRFISCWVSVGEDLVFIVDPGPPSTADYLISRLEELGIASLDYILLTHVHLDHGGCTSRILERWPGARVVCHEKGRGHLIDPTRLWAGSREVLGDKAAVYGEPSPVPATALAEWDELALRGVDTIPTPGHAAHHVAFRQGGDLFIGEAAGTFSDLGAGPGSEDYYLRPATPPRFFPDVARASLERLLALDPLPSRILFAHHGAFTGDVARLLSSAQDQLSLWVDTAGAVLQDLRSLPHSEQPADHEGLMDLISSRLLRVDDRFARGATLPEDIRKRETDFTRQTLRGILGHLRS